MNQDNLFQILSDLRSKVDMQSVDNAYIKDSLNKLYKIVTEDMGVIEDKINERLHNFELRFKEIETEHNNKTYLKSIIISPAFSFLCKYFSRFFFTVILFCMYEGVAHMHDIKMLNFS
jgi:hypothetical protein